MKINKDVRSRLKAYLIDKAFSEKELEELKKGFIKSLDSFTPLKERRKMYKLAPDYISTSTTIRIISNSPKGRGYSRNYREVSIPFQYALKRGEYGYFSIEVDEDKNLENYPDLLEKTRNLVSYYDRKAEYCEKVTNILEIYQSSTPLIKVLPECEEFFEGETHGINSKNSLIPIADLNFVRGCLNKTEGEK